jgi:hypothetical protein
MGQHFPIGLKILLPDPSLLPHDLLLVRYYTLITSEVESASLNNLG